MNRRFLFKKLFMMVGAIFASPLISKSRPARYFTFPDGVRADLKTGHFYYPINGKLVRSEWLTA